MQSIDNQTVVKMLIFALFPTKNFFVENFASTMLNRNVKNARIVTKGKDLLSEKKGKSIISRCFKGAAPLGRFPSYLCPGRHPLPLWGGLGWGSPLPLWGGLGWG